MPTLTLRDGMRAVRLKLWDEEHQRMVTFAQARVTAIHPLPIAQTGAGTAG